MRSAGRIIREQETRKGMQRAPANVRPHTQSSGRAHRAANIALVEDISAAVLLRQRDHLVDVIMLASDLLTEATSTKEQVVAVLAAGTNIMWKLER